MADLDFSVNADTTAAQRNLKRLQGSVGGITSTLKRFGGVLAGAFAVRDIVRITSSFTDLQSRLKNVTGSTADAERVFKSITETARATYSSIEQTSEGFLRNAEVLKELGFSTDQQIQVSEALNNALTISGTKGAQAESVMNALSKAFASGKLSGQNLNTVLESGGEITNTLRNALGVTTQQLREMGRAGELDTGRVINILISQLGRLKQEASDMPATINDGFVLLRNSLTQLVGTFDSVTGTSSSAAGVLERLADTISELSQSLEKNAAIVKDVASGLANLALILGSLFVVSKIIGPMAAFFLTAADGRKTIGSLVKGMFGLTSVIGVAGQGLGMIATVFANFGNAIRNPVAAIAFLVGGFSRLIPIVAVVTTAIYAIDAAFKIFSSTSEGLFSRIDRGIQSLLGLANITYKTSKQKQELLEQEKKQQQALKFLQNESFQAAAKQQQQTVEGINLVKKQTEEQEKLKAARSNVASMRESFESFNNSSQQQQQALKQQIEQQRQNIGLTENQREVKAALFDLEQIKTAEITKLTEAYNTIRKSGHEEELKLLPEILNSMNEVEASYARQRAEVEALVKQKQQEMEIETQRAALADFAANQQIDTSNQLQKVQDDINKSTMTETERKYYDIAAASRDSAKSAIDAENARRRSLGVAKMTAEEERRYYNEATTNSQRLIDKTKEHERVRRDFSTGWSRAYRQYAEDAGNASKHAEAMFSKAAQGMEDAFVDFAKTGKFEWNDFLASLAEEALRYELKGIFADIMAGKADATSTLNQLQGAIGSKIGSNKPAAQGGAGTGDLMNQLGGLFNSMGAAKTQAPQGAIGSRPIQSNPTPAPVAPTTNNITYTINAVDAPSFKQLVAQDPAFIYAVTVQGARTLAGRR